MSHRDPSSCGIQDLCPSLPECPIMFFVFSIAHFSAKEAGDLSTLFDVGGIIGEPLSFCPGRLSFLLASLQRCRKKGQQAMIWAVAPEKKGSWHVLTCAPARLGGPKKDDLCALVSWSDGCGGRLQRERWSFLRPGQHWAG